jgi:hypothetical protein
MGGETLNPQRCIPNMITIPSKLGSVASGNQKQCPAAAEMAAADRTKTKVSPTSSGETIRRLHQFEVSKIITFENSI